MELLIIKSENAYIRVVNSQYTVCAMDKASVFPPDKLENVKEHVRQLRERDYSEVYIFKLRIAEEPFDEASI